MKINVKLKTLTVVVSSAACAMAAEVRIDFDRVTGPIHAVHGTGQGPLLGYDDFSMFRYLKEAGIPYARLHDVAGAFGKNLFVDIPNIFRDFDADVEDPASYDFVLTDEYIQRTLDAGTETFYRLGAKIEHEIKKYHINLVKDCNSIGGRRNIAILNNDYKRVDKVFDFIDKNKKKIYKICFNDSILLDALDKFYFYVNSHKNMISNNRQVTKSVNVEKMLRFPELLKPQWLLHFTPSKDNAIDICLNGFRRGMNLANIDKLAYSNSDDYEKNGKFCYAYDAKGFVESSIYTIHHKGGLEI